MSNNMNYKTWYISIPYRFNESSVGVSLTFAIRAKKWLFLGIHRRETLDYEGVTFQNGL